MSNPLPNFDNNLVMPPYLGNPTLPADLSPYKYTSVDLGEKFATSPERISILNGFLAFRKQLTGFGLLDGFQWINGSFLEDIETREQRPPNDIDVVTIYFGYDIPFQNILIASFPEFLNSQLSKHNYYIDHYPFDAEYSSNFTVDYSRYWVQLFSHNRDAVWKGMLQIALNTPAEDSQALQFLNAK